MQSNTQTPRHPHTQTLLSRLLLLPPLLLILAGVLAYWNSFDGVFVYDDVHSIRDNPHISRLWPLNEAMSLPLWSTGTTVDGRPLLSLTFALNHWLFGPEPWGYHLVNLLIHIAAGLLLFGIVRRTLALPQVRERYGRSGRWLALATAAIWLVHPLQTESVTYIVQRAESLMGMLFLLTMYCSIRVFEQDSAGDVDDTDGPRGRGPSREISSAGHGRGDGLGARAQDAVTAQNRAASHLSTAWQLAAVAACAIGMGVKQTLFSAPLLVILYDYVFTGGLGPGGLALGERGLRRAGHVARPGRPGRGRFYAALCSTWLIVFTIIALTWQESTIDFVKISPLRYALTQPLVILHYLRLAIWPSPLVLSYGWLLEDQWPRIVFPALAILGLLVAMVRGLWRRKWYGFVAAWFFLILAPTSSIAPMRQAMFEHRMYLSLAAVVVLAVIAVASGLRRICKDPGRAATFGGALAVTTVIVFGVLTHHRNSDYHNAIGLWRDSLTHRYRSHIAHLNLGSCLQTEGRSLEALRHLQVALTLKPDYAEAHSNLGNTLLALGRPGEAIPHHREALRMHPNSAAINYNLGIALEAVGQRREAIDSYREAVRLKPDLADAHYNLGNALLKLGRAGEAIGCYQRTVQLKPDHADAHNNLGVVHRSAGRLADAIRHFEEAVRLKPDYTVARDNLRKAREMMGKKIPKHPSTQIPKE